MTRSEFLNRLLTLGGLAFLRLPSVQHYQKYYLLQCFVRGFRYYEGPSLLGRMKQGDLVELVRKPDSRYDPQAIALHWNEKKIGFLPMEENSILSKLMDLKAIDLLAEIGYVEQDAAPWENVFAAVYVLKEAPPVPQPDIVYLTQLETPEYNTLSYTGNRIVRIEKPTGCAGKDEEIGVDDYYQYLVDNSRDDSIYGHIHDHLDPTAHYEEQGDFLVVDKKKLAAQKPSLLQQLETIESDLYDTEKMFDREGMMVLNVRKADGLIQQVSGLGDVADRLGRKFIELEF